MGKSAKTIRSFRLIFAVLSIQALAVTGMIAAAGMTMPESEPLATLSTECKDVKIVGSVSQELNQMVNLQDLVRD